MLSASIAMTGLYMRTEASRRCSAIKQCMALISYFRAGILYAEEPLISLVSSAAGCSEFSLLGFLGDILESDLSDGFSFVWSRSIDKLRYEKFLGYEAVALLKAFGDKLGKTERAAQTEMCDRYLADFEGLIKREQERLESRKKLIGTSSAAISVLVFVLLI